MTPIKRRILHPEKPTIIVFSHLRWEFVTQRPQHIISRFKNERIYVEETIECDMNSDARIYQAAENLKVMQPKHGKTLEALESILQKEKRKIIDPILWFYSASFHELSDQIDHSLIVYDCMDELSAFKGASEKLIQQEKELLKKAHIVFTGGKSLYEAKRRLHPNVYCYPSSVDSGHFKKALDPNTVVPTDIEKIPRPVVSYIGVIDERIDLKLLENIAERRKEVSFVMIGPVTKINIDELPRRSNIYYLGSKPYGLLPNYLKATDIAMMPFALNKATEFISPTKTLEYIAALKPIVSTPITDVVRDFKDFIQIVENGDQFDQAIEFYLNEKPKDRNLRNNQYAQLLEMVSWDKTVAGMKDNIADLISSEKIETKTQT